MSHLYQVAAAAPLPHTSISNDNDATATPTYPTSAALQTSRWPARWCCHPDVPRTISSVLLFRRVFELLEVPERLLVHVTADQRYRLLVNEMPVSWGPARGDLLRWRYETIDIAPYLKAGENVLAAQVHYFAGDLAPVAQQTAQSGFLCQADDHELFGDLVNTPGGWRVWQDVSYEFTTEPADALWTYAVVGPSEIFHAERHPWGWQTADFDDRHWPAAKSANNAARYECSDGETLWWLVNNTLPQMETTPEPIGKVVRSEEILPPGGWPQSGEWLTIPPDSRVTILLDRGHETCGFPELTVSGGGGGATIRLSYAEALVLPDVKPNDPNRKGNRNEVGDRALRGYTDTWILDGGTARNLRPLWWRTFRYAELTIITQEQSLTIERVRNIYTGYPFAERAAFDVPEQPELAELWKIGWRTARLCAHETYMDCPYYEQLQYAGDTRIQCLVTLYTSGDARLFKNALMQFHDSRIGDGLTQSRYPSRILQVIPPFSLWYIGMAHDYWRHVPDQDEFLHELLPGLRGILGWFRARIRSADGLLGKLEWWNFVDWCPEWKNGVPPGAAVGGTAVITLQYAIALREVAEIAGYLGRRTEAAQFESEAAAITRSVLRTCYDNVQSLVYDTPERQSASQHAAILLLLADNRLPLSERQALMERVLSDNNLTQTTFYFRFYLNRALVSTGLGDRYAETLPPWHAMRAMGLTTWAENPEPTRSDCHAWSSSPNYEFLATVLGVRPGALPGWGEVVIAPHVGQWTNLSGRVPHPRGEVAVSLRRDGEVWEANVTLPAGVTGQFLWRNGDMYSLTSGRQTFTVMRQS